MRRPFVIANWKMNLLCDDAKSFCKQFLKSAAPLAKRCDIGVAPSFTALATVVEELGASGEIFVGAQNCHWLSSGAHTGEISPAMVREVGARFVIVGHSERRQLYGESDARVAERAKAAIQAGMHAVVCIGETHEEYQSKKTAERIAAQLEGSLHGISREEIQKLVVAYEPVWAIGTGLSATPETAATVHRQIRKLLAERFSAAAETIRVIYGGSTSPENIGALMAIPEIDGALVGGASLKPDTFIALIRAGLLGKGIALP